MITPSIAGSRAERDRGDPAGDRRGRRGRRLAPVLGVGTVVLAMAMLHLLGGRALSGPPLGSWAELRHWAEVNGPVTMALVVLRLAALGVGYHLIATTALGVIGQLLRWPGLVGLAERATLAPLRGTFRRLAGIGLSASVVLVTPLPSIGAAGSDGSPAVAAAAHPSPGEAAIAQRDPPGTGDQRATMVVVDRAPPAASADGAPEATVTLRVVPEETPSPSGPTATMRVIGSSPPEDPVVTEPAEAPKEPTRSTDHVVVVGDHLWAIAEHQLATALGHQPSDAETEPYWRSVVSANPQLADPDLVFPGDTLHVPPVPGH